MVENMIKLPESELEIMQAIWILNERGEKFVSAGLIMRNFPDITRLKLTTVLTLITRLQYKGFVKSEKLGKANCYTPLISAQDYRKFATDDFIERVYMNDKTSLISSLLKKLSSEELDEIIDLVAIEQKA